MPTLEDKERFSPQSGQLLSVASSQGRISISSCFGMVPLRDRCKAHSGAIITPPKPMEQILCWPVRLSGGMVFASSRQQRFSEFKGRGVMAYSKYPFTWKGEGHVVDSSTRGRRAVVLPDCHRG